MYVIQDETNGRYLSARSATEVEEGEPKYITYNGKLGTDFFTQSYEAEKLYQHLKRVFSSYGVIKHLEIVFVNIDLLPLGNRFVENLYFAKELIIK